MSFSERKTISNNEIPSWQRTVIPALIFLVTSLILLRENPRAIPPTPNGYGRTSSPQLDSDYKVL